ncbi:uncharacterized protein LOC62_02G003473 [Vanrija pseudolonga]|uniref:BRCT domain-containing protein n=1 Tax=Vanrija pseudolonga TaxID=143232 RepID=A0AAF0Y8J7_9TREE|nr:hypothetical protein LOC62_02G003473 [Vanrija pseudolonga]
MVITGTTPPGAEAPTPPPAEGPTPPLDLGAGPLVFVWRRSAWCKEAHLTVENLVHQFGGRLVDTGTQSEDDKVFGVFVIVPRLFEWNLAIPELDVKDNFEERAHKYCNTMSMSRCLINRRSQLTRVTTEWLEACMEKGKIRKPERPNGQLRLYPSTTEDRATCKMILRRLAKFEKTHTDMTTASKTANDDGFYAWHAKMYEKPQMGKNKKGVKTARTVCKEFRLWFEKESAWFAKRKHYRRNEGVVAEPDHTDLSESDEEDSSGEQPVSNRRNRPEESKIYKLRSREKEKMAALSRWTMKSSSPFLDGISAQEAYTFLNIGLVESGEGTVEQVVVAYVANRLEQTGMRVDSVPSELVEFQCGPSSLEPNLRTDINFSILGIKLTVQGRNVVVQALLDHSRKRMWLGLVTTNKPTDEEKSDIAIQANRDETERQIGQVYLGSKPAAIHGTIHVLERGLEEDCVPANRVITLYRLVKQLPRATASPNSAWHTVMVDQLDLATAAAWVLIKVFRACEGPAGSPLEEARGKHVNSAGKGPANGAAEGKGDDQHKARDTGEGNGTSDDILNAVDSPAASTTAQLRAKASASLSKSSAPGTSLSKRPRAVTDGETLKRNASGRPPQKKHAGDADDTSDDDSESDAVEQTSSADPSASVSNQHQASNTRAGRPTTSPEDEPGWEEGTAAETSKDSTTAAWDEDAWSVGSRSTLDDDDERQVPPLGGAGGAGGGDGGGGGGGPGQNGGGGQSGNGRKSGGAGKVDEGKDGGGDRSNGPKKDGAGPPEGGGKRGPSGIGAQR